MELRAQKPTLTIILFFASLQVKVYKIFECDMRVFFLMELAVGGDMLDYINSHGYIPEAQAQRFFRETVDAVDYCHSQNIVHR